MKSKTWCVIAVVALLVACSDDTNGADGGPTKDAGADGSAADGGGDGGTLGNVVVTTSG